MGSNMTHIAGFILGIGTKLLAITCPVIVFTDSRMIKPFAG